MPDPSSSPRGAARLFDRVQQIRAARDQGALSSRAPISKATRSSPKRARRRRCMLAETPGLCRGDGCFGPLGAGRHRAGHDRAERAGRARFLCRTARHDRAPAEGGVAGRRRLYLLARRGADDRGGRSRRGAVREGAGDRRTRCADRRDLGSARQCLRTHGATRSTPLSAIAPTRISTCASAAPRRPRRSARCWPGLQAAGGLHPPADRAADGDDADRRRPLCRDDRSRPATDEPGDPERVGDGRVRLCRHRRERSQRRRDRAPRQSRPPEVWRARSPNSAGPTGRGFIRG